MVMMLRFVRVWWISRMRRRIAVDEASRFTMRVWLNDLDFNIHMNNGRYFSAADLGRLDWWVRSGLWHKALARGWRPMAGDANARFSRQLRPFQKYELQTRMVGWNEKWLFAEHRFVVGTRVHAVIVVRYLFVARDGSRPAPAQIMALGGWNAPSPPLPEFIELWHRGQDSLSAELRAGR
jgi:acyl-CoA thioesterase FadM